MRVKRILGVFIIATLMVVGAASTEEDEKPLTNADVVKLTKLDMGNSVIIAKIKSARAVKFSTATDDLVKLKEAGVSKEVITAMIDRSEGAPAAASATPASGAAPTVTLQTKDGPLSLKPVDGDVKSIVAPFVGFRRFVVFSDVSAPIRTKDRRPTVLVTSSKDPRKTWWIVRLDQDDDPEDMDRSIDVESPGYWGGTLSSAPDGDFQIQYDATEEKPGLWKITPRKDLKPGEYGLYIGKGELTATLYDFGVDK